MKIKNGEKFEGIRLNEMKPSTPPVIIGVIIFVSLFLLSAIFFIVWGIILWLGK